MESSLIGNLVGIASLIGSTLAAPLVGWALDYFSSALATRTKGVFELEFRLPLIIPFVVIITIGTFGLGATIDRGLRPVVCSVFLAILNFGIGLNAIVYVSYSNEIAQHRAGEALDVAMLVKSLFAFGISFVAN